MYSCEEVLTALSDYFDDELSKQIRRQIESHMSECKTCRAVYDSTRKTLQIVTESGSFELSSEVSARVAERIRVKVRAIQADKGGS